MAPAAVQGTESDQDRMSGRPFKVLFVKQQSDILEESFRAACGKSAGRPHVAALPTLYCRALQLWPHTFKPQLSRPALLGWPDRPSLPRTSLMCIIENLVFWETLQFQASLGGWSLGISLEGNLESICAYLLRELPGLLQRIPPTEWLKTQNHSHGSGRVDSFRRQWGGLAQASVLASGGLPVAFGVLWLTETSLWPLPSSSRGVVPVHVLCPNFPFVKENQLCWMRGPPHSSMTSA